MKTVEKSPSKCGNQIGIYDVTIVFTKEWICYNFWWYFVVEQIQKKNMLYYIELIVSIRYKENFNPLAPEFPFKF